VLGKSLDVKTTYEAALASFTSSNLGGWAALPFFQAGAAQRLGAKLDANIEEGRKVLPSPANFLNALELTPLDQVRVVILGQDPYPTPGDAHGFAFSVEEDRSIPRSLGNIFKELHADIGIPRPSSGNLTLWANQGVLLLNTCLTVEAGVAGSHRKLGWEALTDQMISAVSENLDSVIFILWGADAQTKRKLIDESKHCVLASVHPSPLSARRGFFGSRPFSKANHLLREKGLPEIDWSVI
jgi:uracil-DNA glycosylase